MAFVYETRSSNSQLVEAIWRTEDTANGMYLAAAGGAWDMIFIKRDGRTDVLLRGPSSYATPVSYRQGNRNLGIRFRPGSFMLNLPAVRMVNTMTVLPQIRPNTFWFDGLSWEIPNFDNADIFVEKLIQNSTLAQDSVVENSLRGDVLGITQRSVQRHFLQATGLSLRYHQQIRRAGEAIKLLETGHNILEVVHRLGYADQPHMSRIIKHMSGCTPGQIIQKMERARRLHSINGYGVCAEMKVINFNGGIHAHKTLQASNQAGRS
jgi:AraC-like DNA-binding protein